MSKSNATLVMAVLIAIAFFLSSPGVIWSFPESNVSKIGDITKANKTDVAVHAALFGIAVAFAYPYVNGIVSAIPI